MRYKKDERPTLGFFFFFQPECIYWTLSHMSDFFFIYAIAQPRRKNTHFIGFFTEETERGTQNETDRTDRNKERGGNV